MATYQAGTGPNIIALLVSGTAYGGVLPQFRVSIDGKQVGDVFNVTTPHGQGSDTVILNGTWAPGSHHIDIDYLNDAFNPAADWSNPATVMAVAGNDRNLFVDGILQDGVLQAGGVRGIYNDTGPWTAFRTGPDPVAQDVVAKLALQGATLTGGDQAAYFASYGITAADLAAYQADFNTAVSAAGMNPATVVGTGVPTFADTKNFDFNGMRWEIKHVEDMGNPQTLNNLWGDAEIINQIAISRSPVEGLNSGIMDHAGSADAGFGYGLYMLPAKLNPGFSSGGYVALWPGTDRWPGPEVDLVEILPGTNKAYGTLHWDKNPGVDGGAADNGYESVIYEGVNPAEFHFYWVNWQPGSITFGVDDKAYKTFTEHVPVAFADGGENLIPGIGTKYEGTPNTAELAGVIYATPTAAATGLSLGQITGAALDTPLL